MAKFIAISHLGTLRPVDEQGRAELSKLRQGQQVEIELKRARNPRQHRLYWGLVGLIFHQQSRYATQEQLSNALKCAVGFCDEVELMNGKTMVTPKSMSFANMKQDEFEPFFDKVIEVVITKILPGVSNADLRRELAEMVGVAA